MARGDRRHNNGDGRHDDGRHDNGKGQQGDRRHDDGDGKHDDGDGRLLHRRLPPIFIAEILGDPYSKMTPLPSIDAIGTSPCLVISPKDPSY